MRGLIIACLLAVFADNVVFAASRYWNAAGDVSRPWTDAANWDDGTQGVPQPGDLVIVRDRGTPPLVVNDDDAAIASQVMFIYSAQTNKTAGDVIWNVSTNVDFQNTFGDWYTSNGGHPGRFIKRGAGDFNCRANVNDGNSVYKPPHWVIERGVFRYPQFDGIENPSSAGFGGGYLTVSNGATVVVYNNANSSFQLTVTWDHVVSHGLITNASPVNTFVGFNSKPENPSEIYGPIGGVIRLNTGDSVNLHGTNNTFNIMRPNGRRGVNPQVIGVMQFEGNPSSLGTDSEINYDYNGPIWRYLGNAPQTVTKPMRAKIHEEYFQGRWDAYHPMTIDGGAYGALTMVNTVYVENDNLGKINGLCVQGTNANPCVYKMTQRIYETTKGNGVWCPVHMYKRGSGVWEFPFAESRTQSGAQPFMVGGFSIEEGTVRADVITDQNQPSSLGAGSLCFGDYVGVYDETKLVDWTISFGTEDETGAAKTEGTLEYVGDLPGFSSNRKMVLLGDGRISNNGANVLQMACVAARTPGEKTLTLAGVNDQDNVLSEISDGAGTVSVAKEGAGRWILRGNQTFSGDLRVKGGVLEVQAPTNDYRYFRLTFMAMHEGGDSYFSPFKMAFFDKNGNILSQNSYLPPPWSDSGEGTKNADGYFEVSRDFLSLPDAKDATTSGLHGSRAGYFVPGRPGNYQWGTWAPNGPGYVWFTNDSRGDAYMAYPRNGGTPSLNKPWTWFSIVIRLRSDTGEVAFYDIAAGANVKRNPSAWMLEGSRDGICWHELDRRMGVAYPGSHNWYSDGTAWAAGNRSAAAAGYPISCNSAVSSLQNVRAVQVAQGALLVTAAENVGEIRRLTIGATGFGTVDGFAFAESGTVDFEDVPERLHEALSYSGTIRNDGGSSANLRGWSFTVNGAVNARRAMTYRNGTFSLMPPGLSVIIR